LVGHVISLSPRVGRHAFAWAVVVYVLLLACAITVPFRPCADLQFTRHRPRPGMGFLNGESITFLSVPNPQRIPDQIQMAKLCLSVWLSYPFARVIMFTNESD
jgi:hypothetical protein